MRALFIGLVVAAMACAAVGTFIDPDQMMGPMPAEDSQLESTTESWGFWFTVPDDMAINVVRLMTTDSLGFTADWRGYYVVSDDNFVTFDHDGTDLQSSTREKTNWGVTKLHVACPGQQVGIFAVRQSGTGGTISSLSADGVNATSSIQGIPITLRALHADKAFMSGPGGWQSASLTPYYDTRPIGRALVGLVSDASPECYFSGNPVSEYQDVYGYSFVAPHDFQLMKMYEPKDVLSGKYMSFAVLRSDDGSTWNSATRLWSDQNADDSSLAVSISADIQVPIYAGDLIAVFASRGTSTFAFSHFSSRTTAGSFSIPIGRTDVPIFPCEAEFFLQAAHQIVDAGDFSCDTTQGGAVGRVGLFTIDRFPGFIYNDSPNDGDSVSGTTYRFHGVRFTPRRQATAVRVQYRLQNVDGAGYARVIFQEGNVTYLEHQARLSDDVIAVALNLGQKLLVPGVEYTAGAFNEAGDWLVRFLEDGDFELEHMTVVDFVEETGSFATPPVEGAFPSNPTVTNRVPPVMLTIFYSPDPVTGNPGITNLRTRSFDVVWNVPTSKDAPATSYTVARYLASAPGLPQAETTVTATSISMTGLTHDETYNVSVAPVNMWGTGNAAWFSVTTPEIIPTISIVVQPGDGVAAQALGIQPSVSVTDQFGDPVSYGVLSAVLDGCGGSGAVLSGATSIALSAETVAFTNLKVDKAGTCRLHFEWGAWSSADTAPFDIIPGAATTMAFTTQPVGAASGVLIGTPVVTLYDVAGNVATGAAGNVDMELFSGSGTLSGTLSVVIASGTATFGDLSVNLAGTKVIQASTDVGVSAVNSESFVVVAGPPDAVVFETDPGGGVATVPWDASDEPVVSLVDAAGNLVTGTSIEVAVSVTGGMPALGGNTGPLPLTSGSAVFAGLVVNTTGTYTLTTVVSGDGGLVSDAVSATFDIAAGPPVALVWTMATPVTTGGTPLPLFEVRVEDAGGNTVEGVEADVVLTLNTSPGGAGTLSGTVSATSVLGIATFANAILDVASTGPEYGLTATAATLGLSSDSPAITVNVGPAVNLAFVKQPGGGAAALAWESGDQPVVAAVDAGGNVVESVSSGSVTLSKESGPAGVLSGTLTRAFASGLAAFDDLQISATGSYTLRATTGAGYSDVVSEAVSIGSSGATDLAFVAEPVDSTGGVALGASVTVEVVDTGLVRVTSGGPYTVTLTKASGPGTLSGVLVRDTVAGLATFSGLSADLAGNYSLDATSGLLGSATSATFTVSVGPAVAASFVVVPSPTGLGGAVLGQQPEIALSDAGGNTVTTGYNVSVAVQSGPGPVTASPVTLMGATAVLSGVRLDAAGSYVLETWVSPSAGVAKDSAGVTVAVGAPASLVFTGGATSSLGGAVVAPSLVAEVRDAGGNVVFPPAYDLVLSTETGPGSPSGTLTETSDASGVVTFDNLVLDAAGVYALRGSLVGMASIFAVAPTITVSQGPVAALAVGLPVSGTTQTAGVSFEVAVGAFDAGGNQRTDGVDQVTLSLAGGGTELSGTLGPLATSGGTATFAAVEIGAAGVYTLRATAAGGSVTADGASITVQAPPEAIAAVILGSNALGNVSLSWGEPFDGHSTLVSYECEYRLAGGGGVVAFSADAGNGPAVVLSGLTLNTGYEFRVAPRNGVGQSAFTEWFGFTTAAGPPGQVGGLAVSAAARSLSCTWSAPVSNGGVVTGYLVDVATDAAFTGLVVTNLAVQGPAASINNGINPVTSYWVRVAAVNVFGTGVESVAATATTQAAIAAPLQVTALVATATEVTVQWSPRDPAHNYTAHISRSVNITDPLVFFVDDGSATEATFGPLESGVDYYLDMWLTNDVGEGEHPGLPWLFSTLGALPDAPVPELGATLEPTEFEVVWETPAANGGILRGLRIVVTKEDDGSVVVDDSVAYDKTDYDVDEGVEAGTRYEVVMFADSDVGDSAASAVLVVETPTEGEVQVDGGSGLGLILGIVGGVAAVAVLVLLLVCCLCGGACCCRERKLNYASAQRDEDATVNIALSQEDAAKMRVEHLLKKKGTKAIGGGGAATVYKAKLDSGEWIALKVLRERTAKFEAEFHREGHVLSKLAAEPHNNIIGLRMFCSEPPVIGLDLVERGSLHAILFNPEAALSHVVRAGYMGQVVQGVCYLHCNDIAHLDLKPHNVLVTEAGICKLTDFGVCAETRPGELVTVHEFNGTPKFAAPERFVADTAIDLIQADLYSLGVTLWTIWTLREPFADLSVDAVVGRLKAMLGSPVASLDREFDLSLAVGGDDKLVLGTEAREGIAALVSVQPVERPSAFDLLNPLFCDEAPYRELRERHARYHARRYGSGTSLGSFNTATAAGGDNMTMQYDIRSVGTAEGLGTGGSGMMLSGGGPSSGTSTPGGSVTSMPPPPSFPVINPVFETGSIGADAAGDDGMV